MSKFSTRIRLICISSVLITWLFLNPVHSIAQDVQVDPLTGRASLALPIWTISHGDLSVPIGLSYSTNGVKVHDTGGNAGMGFQLVAGGSVFREVRGLPDDFIGKNGDTRNGWLHNDIAREVNNWSPATANDCQTAGEIANYNKLEGWQRNKDTEADIFSFSAPGLSGSFVYDKNKVIRPLPFQDLKIVTLRGADSLIYQIEITNNVGVKYTFSSGDQVTRRSSLYYSNSQVKYFQTDYLNYRDYDCTFYRTWNLTSISSPAGGVITLTYTNYSDEFLTGSFMQLFGDQATLDTTYTINDRIITKDLVSVVGANTTAYFTWAKGVLSLVKIRESYYQTEKIFRLGYRYVKSGKYYRAADKNVKRAFLSEFGQEVNCVSYPKYKFNYYGVYFGPDSCGLPYKTSKYMDLFGYYNGENAGLKARVYIRDGDVGTDGDRYRFEPATNYSFLPSGSATRAVNPTYVHFGSLKTVTFPSGGTSTITYEPSDYYDALTNSTKYGAGIRVKSIKTTTSGSASNSDFTTSYNYKRSKKSTLSSGQWVYRPMFAFYGETASVFTPFNMAPDEVILYSRVELATTGKGKTVYEFQNLGTYNQTSTGDFNATYSRYARPGPAGSCGSFPGLRSGYYSFPFIPNTYYEFERGLVSKVSHYTSQWKLVGQQSYTYQRTSYSITTISGVKYEKVNGVYLFGKYDLLSNVGKLKLTETSRTYDQNDTTKYVEGVSSYEYSSSQMVNKISTTGSEGTTIAQNFKYAKDYALTGTDTQSTMITGLVNGNRHGSLIESWFQNGSTITGGTLTLYNNNFGQSRILPWQTLTLGDPTGFAASSVSGTTFSKAAGYYPVMYADAYDDVGNVTITRDQSRQSRSVVLGLSKTVPILEISNGRNDQVVFSDFELGEVGAFTFNGATEDATNVYTGKKSLKISNGNSPQASLTRGTGSWYRFSAWVYGTAASTLTIKYNNGATWYSDTVKYPTASASKWKYLEKRMSITNAPTSGNFNLQVNSSATVYADDILFYPESSDVVSHTYDPLNGKLADIDSRGVGVYQEYDALGRLRFIRNRDKDIVQIKDYHYKSSSAVLPVSSFSASGPIYTNAAATLTVEQSCMGGVTYAWSVDEVSTGVTTTSLNYTFSENRDYQVKLTASSNFGASVTEMTIHPIPAISLTVTMAQGESNLFNCQDATFERHLTLTIAGCFDSARTYFSVRRTTDPSCEAFPPYIDCSWVQPGSYSYTFTVSLNSGSNNVFILKAYTSCYNKNTGEYDATPIVVTNKTFTWQIVSPC